MARQFELDSRLYTWNGRRWLGNDDHREPPKDIVRKLAALLRRANRAAENSLDDPSELLGIAVNARVTGNPGRAERFARRVLVLDPENPTAAAILCSIWREKGRAKAALALADRFQGSDDAYVLTSRGAALCDLGRWDEALLQIRQVLALETNLQGGGSEEALAVYGRIRANAPHLFGELNENEDADPSPANHPGGGSRAAARE